MDIDVAWTILPATEFGTAQPREPGELGAEVLGQLRETGRFMDDVRVASGGSKILEANFYSHDIFCFEMLPTASLVLQKRPEDVVLRNNATSSIWYDVNALLQAREIIVEGQEDDIDEFLSLINNLSDLSEAEALIRWAVIAPDDLSLELVLQALPAAAAILNSRSVFKG
jgi:hypothetical protein